MNDLFDPDDESIKDDQTAGAYWKCEIDRSQKEFKTYWEKCDKIAKRYRDERDQNRENAKRFNILWSNIQTMKPAVYAKAPKPIIERRFLERNDIERVAGIALQRAVAVEIETSDFEEAVGGKQGAVMDYLLYSRGMVWLRYEADLNTEDESTPLTDIPEGNDEVEQEETSLPTVTAERICIDYVHRKDYLCDPARTEQECRWKAKRSWLTKRQVKDKFGDEIAGKVEYRQINDDDRYDDKQAPKERRAEFWEIWDKVRRKVWVINTGYDGICKVTKDPLGLKNFWPCPRPLYGTMTDDKLVPIPDYIEYQDQAEQLDQLSQRIDKITQAIKAVGFFDASQPELGRLFEFGTDNKMVPCETWAVMKDKGGLAGSVDFFPLDMLIKTLETLQTVFDSQLQRLYEVTGIADIIRGNSSPEETYGAQKIKGQFATLRLQDRQRDVSRFCRDIVSIMTELIAVHFEPETIAAMTGLGDQNSPDAQYFQQAMELVGDARLRSFRVDIETNSTIELDINEDKKNTTEFVNGVAQYFNQIMPAAEKMPQLIPLAGNVLLWAIRRFRTGRELESVFERAVDDFTRMSQSGALTVQQPNPEMLKIQAQQQSDMADLQLQREKMQNDAQMSEAQMRFEMLKHQNDMAFQQKQHEEQMELERLKLGAQVHLKDKDIQQQDKEHQYEMDLKQVDHAHDSTEREKDRSHESLHKLADQEHEGKMKKEDHAHEATEKGKDRQAQSEQADKTHSATEKVAKIKANPKGEDSDLSDLKKQLDELMKHHKAPVEILRGKDGKITGARRVLQ